jgi:mono/diheme cytochrome c family protein
MNKRIFVLFAIFAVVFAIAIPVWATSKEGGEENSPAKVAASDEYAKELFATNCGACHTLQRAGTDGIVGPNLDDLLGGPAGGEANEQRVLTAIENGVEGRMPAGILRGTNAEVVANFVAREAGQ